MPENWWDSSRKVESDSDDWWKESKEAPVDPNSQVLRGELRQGAAPYWWEGPWESARQAIFGSPDREEAKAAGVGLQPTPADMADAAMAGGAFFAGPVVGAAAARGAGSVIGRAGGWVARNPAKVGAVTGAIPGALKGDPIETVQGAVLGATAGKVAGSTNPVETLRKAKALVTQGKTEEARALIDAARQAAAESAPVAAAATAKTAVPAAAKVVDAGRAAASSHRALMDFAKKVAQDDPKVGEKIWMLLDDAGSPIRRLTSDQAGAAARKGQRTTWVKNLWR